MDPSITLESSDHHPIAISDYSQRFPTTKNIRALPQTSRIRAEERNESFVHISMRIMKASTIQLGNQGIFELVSWNMSTSLEEKLGSRKMNTETATVVKRRLFGGSGGSRIRFTAMYVRLSVGAGFQATSETKREI